MQNRNKSRQRSVATQNAEFIDVEIDSEYLPKRLSKKAGFRNLLQKSVTVAHDENDRKSDNVTGATGGKTSRSVQVSLDGYHKSMKYSNSGNSNLEFSSSPATVSEMLRTVDRKTINDDPGTSRITPNVFSSISLLSHKNEINTRQRENSVAVIYSHSDKSTYMSRTSNAYFYGSQGSRRFSDETVLLIEDYHSYDYLNAAGRQDSTAQNHSRSSRYFSCCHRKSRRSTDPLTRPVPISFDNIDEDDESMVCRICHEGENVEPLLQPCLCKGSVGCVHARCLKIWLEQSNTSRCELCNYPYAIRQNKRYSKWISIMVFFGTVMEKRSLVYDAISFVVITPLTIVGVAMCIQASVFSTGSEESFDSNFHMGNITRAGMIMLSATIIVAYGVWLYTLISYHFKAWKKWYNNCYDVEVIPVKMTSEERLEASQKLYEELNRRNVMREPASSTGPMLRSPHSTSYSFYQRQISVSEGFR